MSRKETVSLHSRRNTNDSTPLDTIIVGSLPLDALQYWDPHHARIAQHLADSCRDLRGKTPLYIHDKWRTVAGEESSQKFCVTTKYEAGKVCVFK